MALVTTALQRDAWADGQGEASMYMGWEWGGRPRLPATVHWLRTSLTTVLNCCASWKPISMHTIAQTGRKASSHGEMSPSAYGAAAPIQRTRNAPFT